jgi:flagellar hook-length control protein FliK
MDPAAMPALALLSVTPSVTLNATLLLGQMIEGAVGGKGASAKQASSGDNNKDSANSPNSFAAYLLAATTAAPLLPIAPASLGATSLPNGSANGLKTTTPVSSSVPVAGAAGPGATPTPSKASPQSLAAAGIKPAAHDLPPSPAQTPSATGIVPSAAKAGQSSGVPGNGASAQAAGKANPGHAEQGTTSKNGSGAATPATAGVAYDKPGANSAAPALLTVHPSSSPEVTDSAHIAATSALPTDTVVVHAATAGAAEVKPDVPASSTGEGLPAVQVPQSLGTTALSRPGQKALVVSPRSSAVQGDSQLSANTPTPADLTPSTASTPATSLPPVAPASVSPAPGVTSLGDGPVTPTVTDQLTRAIVAQADDPRRDGRTDFHLRLEPPQLGTVTIHLVTTNHTVSAHVVVAHEGTRQLLQGQADQLRQSLADAGLSLNGFNVTRDGGGSHGGGQQPPPQEPTSLLAQTAPPPRPTATGGSPTPNPTDGIDILA